MTSHCQGPEQLANLYRNLCLEPAETAPAVEGIRVKGRDAWRGARQRRLWPWVASAVVLALAGGATWFVMAHRHPPGPGEIEEALRPYSTGSTACELSAVESRDIGFPVALDRMWIDLVTEGASEFAGQAAPKKARIEAEIVEGDTPGVLFRFEICDD